MQRRVASVQVPDVQSASTVQYVPVAPLLQVVPVREFEQHQLFAPAPVVPAPRQQTRLPAMLLQRVEQHCASSVQATRVPAHAPPQVPGLELHVLRTHWLV